MRNSCAAASHGRVKLVRATDVEDDTSFNSLAENAVHMRDDGVSVEWSIASGVDAVMAIMNEAEVWQPDLIAIANRTTRALWLAIWWSVATLAPIVGGLLAQRFGRNWSNVVLVLLVVPRYAS